MGTIARKVLPGALISPEVWRNERSAAEGSPARLEQVGSSVSFQFPIRKTGGSQFKRAEKTPRNIALTLLVGVWVSSKG